MGDDKSPYRMRCDYCHRVVLQPGERARECTACGHGKLRLMQVKNWCSICGRPEYGNVSKYPVVLECSRCVEDKLRQMEKDGTFRKIEEARKEKKKGRISRGEARRAKKKVGCVVGEGGGVDRASTVISGPKKGVL